MDHVTQRWIHGLEQDDGLVALRLPAAAGIALSHAVSRVGRPVRRSKVQAVKRQLAYPRLGFHGQNRLQHGKGRRGGFGPGRREGELVHVEVHHPPAAVSVGDGAVRETRFLSFRPEPRHRTDVVPLLAQSIHDVSKLVLAAVVVEDELLDSDPVVVHHPFRQKLGDVEDHGTGAERKLFVPLFFFQNYGRLVLSERRNGFPLAVNLERNSDAFVDVGGGCEKRLKLRGGGVAAAEDFLT